MIVLGLDPGATTGWCAYDTVARCVVGRGQFAGHDRDEPMQAAAEYADHVVIERIVPHGPSWPDVVVSNYTGGRLAERFDTYLPREKWSEMPREMVRRVLSDATYGEVRVKNDSTAWAALVMLHGEGCDRKPRKRKGVVVDAGGCIGAAVKHERAALAVAVAWALLHPAESVTPRAPSPAQSA